MDGEVLPPHNQVGTRKLGKSHYKIMWAGSVMDSGKGKDHR